jgi:hypothetical protein
MTKKESDKYIEDQIRICHEKLASYNPYRRGEGW